MSYPFEPSPAGQPPVAPPPPPWHTPGRTQEPSPAPALMSPPPLAGPPLAGPPMAAPPPPQRPRTSRAALVATATGAALLASTLTAGVTWSLADNGALTRPSAAATATPEAGPAVVPASSTTTQPDCQAVADAVRPSVVAIAVQTAAGSGEGSGVIIDAAGHVLTNDHVAGSAQQLKVTLADGRVFDATLVGADPTTDLAVIALTNVPKDLVPATLGDSDAVAVGQRDLELLGGARDVVVGQHVTRGVDDHARAFAGARGGLDRDRDDGRTDGVRDGLPVGLGRRAACGDDGRPRLG